MSKYGRRYLTAVLLAGSLLATGAPEAEAAAGKALTLNVKSKDCGAAGDGVKNDTAAIQACIKKIEAKGEGTLYFPPGLYVTDSLVLSGDNVSLIGENAVLKSDLPNQAYPADANAVRASALIQNNPKYMLFRVDPAQNIRKGNAFVDLKKGTTMTAVKAGDIVMIETSKAHPKAASYQYGSYRYVKEIRGNRLILDEAIENDLSLASDNVKITVIRPIKNLKIKGLMLDLPENSYQNGIVLENLRNASFSNLTVTAGGQNMMGIGVSGFDITVADSTVSGFLDDTSGLGYGIALYGNRLTATKNTISNCKHAISSADRRYVNKDITYSFNRVSDTQLAALEVHGTGERVKIHDNIITDIGKSYEGSGAVWIRGDHYEVYNNKMTASKTRKGNVSIAGIKTIETASDDISIHHNTIENFDYGYQSETYQPLLNLKFENNTITNATNGVLGNAFSKSAFKGNKVFANATGFYITGLDDSVVDGNEIRYGMSQWGVGVFLAERTSGVSRNIKIRSNKIYPMTASADSHVRVQQGYSVLQVLDNYFDRSNGAISKSVQVETENG